MLHLENIYQSTDTTVSGFLDVISIALDGQVETSAMK